MQKENGVASAVWIIAAVAGVFLLRAASSILIPVVVGILISYLLEPPVSWLARRHVPRPAGAAVMVVATLAAVVAVALSFADEVTTAVRQIPAAVDRLRDLADHTALRDGVNFLQGTAASSALAAVLSSTASSALSMVGDAMIVVFLVYFLLADGRHFCQRAAELSGGSAEIFDDINSRIQRFLLVRLITAAIVGAATWIVLAVMDVDNAAVWAFMAAVFNSVPYFGPIIVSGGLFLIGIGQSGDVWRAVEIAGAALVITSLEGWLITPPLLGKVESMNATVVFVGLLLWTWVWGAWGALLGVPMLVAIKAYADHTASLQPISRWMDP
jgi:predicted PurR-regulated permease PerM